jgi:hypothetical protein
MHDGFDEYYSREGNRFGLEDLVKLIGTDVALPKEIIKKGFAQEKCLDEDTRHWLVAQALLSNCAVDIIDDLSKNKKGKEQELAELCVAFGCLDLSQEAAKSIAKIIRNEYLSRMLENGQSEIPTTNNKYYLLMGVDLYGPRVSTAIAKIANLTEKIDQKLGGPKLNYSVVDGILENLTSADKELVIKLEKYLLEGYDAMNPCYPRYEFLAKAFGLFDAEKVEFYKKLSDLIEKKKTIKEKGWQEISSKLSENAFDIFLSSALHAAIKIPEGEATRLLEKYMHSKKFEELFQHRTSDYLLASLPMPTQDSKHKYVRLLENCFEASDSVILDAERLGLADEIISIRSKQGRFDSVAKLAKKNGKDLDGFYNSWLEYKEKYGNFSDAIKVAKEAGRNELAEFYTQVVRKDVCELLAKTNLDDILQKFQCEEGRWHFLAKVVTKNVEIPKKYATILIENCDKIHSVSRDFLEKLAYQVKKDPKLCGKMMCKLETAYKNKHLCADDIFLAYATLAPDGELHHQLLDELSSHSSKAYGL